VTDFARNKYSIDEPFYVSDNVCFSVMYKTGTARLYELKCKKS